MKRSIGISLAAAVLAVVGVNVAQATIIQPTGSKAQKMDQVGPYNSTRTWTGAEMAPGGFTGTYPVDETKGALVTLSSTCYNDQPWSLPGGGGQYGIAYEWMDGGFASAGGTEWIAWNLGSVQSIGSFHLWNNNQNARGVKDAKLYAISGATYGALVDNGNVVFSIGSGTEVGSYTSMAIGGHNSSYTGEDYTITTTSSQYFLMNISDVYAGFASIQEIRFVTAGGGEVPEPGTWLLLGGSLLGLCVGGFKRIRSKLSA